MLNSKQVDAMFKEKRVCVEIVQDIFDEMGYTVETMRKELGKINE